MSVEPRNAMHHNILGMHLRRMGMCARVWLQAQIMLQKSTLLFTLVERQCDPKPENHAHGTNNPFHTPKMVQIASFYKFGACPC